MKGGWQSHGGFGKGGDLPPGASMGHRLFVTKIAHEATYDEVKDYFSYYGSLIDFYMPMTPSKDRHKGIAFLTYESPDIAESVKSRGHTIRYSEVLVEQAIARHGDASEQGHGDHGDELRPNADGYYKLFVAQLPFEVSKEEVEHYFAQFGELVDTYVPQNHNTGQAKGIAYVTYTEKYAALKALRNASGVIGGRQFKVLPSDGNKGGGKGKGKGSRFSPY